MRPITLLLALLLIISISISAQEVTPEPAVDDYVFDFPLPVPDEDQLEVAGLCLFSQEDNGSLITAPISTCELATNLARQAELRGQEDPTQEEIDAFIKLTIDNPAIILRLPIIASYHNQVALVASPEISEQSITAVHLRYTFGGMGNSLDYDVTITNADNVPEVSGDIQNDNDMPVYEEEATPEPIALADTVDAEVVQALGSALSDLVPIGSQFSSSPCWDYYPDWTVTLTFADESTLEMVTNSSNLIGIGGPWQIDIDGQSYMQYSNAFSVAIVDLLDALGLPLGQTMAMGCGGVTDPFELAWAGDE